MDPSGHSASHMRARFPRPRGDGPLTGAVSPEGRLVSPPTRGWTVPVVGVAELRRGFPAHAGMDPPQSTQGTAPARFPRPRGDGPETDDVATPDLEVSPPTRGWTTTARWLSRSSTGFPAHAGMDRCSRRSLPPCRRFPRPRGDGPTSQLRMRVEATVSPPTRGWTRERITESDVDGGFPAHAGMDPARSRHSPAPRWFPRPRGDGPIYIAAETEAAAVSPPTRGWTSPAPCPETAAGGFPAHAGMDPSTGPACIRCSWFPRPRGDGPTTAITIAPAPGVSPPTRGWTLLGAESRRRSAGFPAHAGMDPYPGPTGQAHRGFPRPRGDGPPPRGAVRSAFLVSPPTRGWTALA